MRYVLALFLGPLLFAGSAAAETVSGTVRILLASDVYKMSEEAGRGGHARLAAAVKSERAKTGAETGAKTNSLFLYVHAGDAISPCLMCGFDQGHHAIELMNMTPPDVFVPGNHEFDFGRQVFLKRMTQAAFPVYAANLSSPDGAAEKLLTRSKIVAAGGVKVGIVGATADDAAAKSNPQDLRIASTVETVQREAAALRSAGADFIIAVVHAARETDKKLMAAKAADLVLSGDDHDLYWSYDGKTGFVEGGEDAVQLNVVEAEISVDVTAEGRRMTWQPAFRAIDTKSVTPDAEVARVVQKYEAELSAELDVTVTDVVTSFDSRSATVRGKENLLGNAVADAVRAGYAADVSLVNGGGLRGGKDYSAGARFSRRDILAELPFSNKVVVLELKGRDIRAVLEHGLSKLPEPSGRFPHVSGARVAFDPSAPAGARITQISIGDEELRDAKTYTLATNDFLFRGGDGYPVLKDARVLVRPEDGRLVANEVLAHLSKHGFKGAEPGGRMVPKP